MSEGKSLHKPISFSFAKEDLSVSERVFELERKSVGASFGASIN